MTDQDGRYANDPARAIRVLSSAQGGLDSFSVAADDPVDYAIAKYYGKSKSILAHPNSPAGWYDVDPSKTGPVWDTPVYQGRSKAIHVFGTTATRPDPIPSCKCCEEGAEGDAEFDTFNGRTVGTTWGTASSGAGAWTKAGPGGSNQSVGDGYGKFEQDGSSSLAGQASSYISGGSAQWGGKFAMLMRFKLEARPASPNAGSTRYGLRDSALTGGYLDQGPGVAFNDATHGDHLYFVPRTGSTVRVAKSWVAGTTYYLEWLKDGGDHQIRVWADGQDPPATPDLSVTGDSTFTPDRFVVFHNGPSNGLAGANVNFYMKLWYDLIAFAATAQGDCEDGCEGSTGGLTSLGVENYPQRDSSSVMPFAVMGGTGASSTILSTSPSATVVAGNMAITDPGSSLYPQVISRAFISHDVPGGTVSARLKCKLFVRVNLEQGGGTAGASYTWALYRGTWGTGSQTYDSIGETLAAGSGSIGTAGSWVEVAVLDLAVPIVAGRVQLVLAATSDAADRVAPTTVQMWHPDGNINASDPDNSKLYDLVFYETDWTLAIGSAVSTQTWANRSGLQTIGSILRETRDTFGAPGYVDDPTLDGSLSTFNATNSQNDQIQPYDGAIQTEKRSYAWHEAPAGATHARLEAGLWGNSSSPRNYSWTIRQGTWGETAPTAGVLFDSFGATLASGSYLHSGSATWELLASVNAYLPIVDGHLRFVLMSTSPDGAAAPSTVAMVYPGENANTSDASGHYKITYYNADSIPIEVPCNNCAECEDPENPGFPLPDFIPGYLPTFRKQIGDPTTVLDSWICTFEAGAMALDWHTQGEVKVWGGELIPWSGRSENSIIGSGGNLSNIQTAWRHWGQTLHIWTGRGWNAVIDALLEGRAVILQGDYGMFTLAERCQDSFDDGHAVVLLPYIVDDRILVGDPLCNNFKGFKASSLKAYAEAFNPSVFFAVTRPWAP